MNHPTIVNSRIYSARSLWYCEPRALFEAAQRPESKAAQPPKVQRNKALAVISVRDLILPRSDGFGGATFLNEFRAEFQAALNDQAVGGILLDIDSPGGMVDGVPETAEMILASRGVKPIVAVANTMAASAAYWLGSVADKFYAVKSGLVGSIGVVMMHADFTKAIEEAGIVVTSMQEPEFKQEFSPFKVLSDEAKAHGMEQIHEVYGWFVDGVAKGRGVSAKQVREEFGKGRVFSGAQAAKLGMVDGVDTLESVAAKMLARSAPGKGTANARARLSIRTRAAIT